MVRKTSIDSVSKLSIIITSSAAEALSQLPGTGEIGSDTTPFVSPSELH